MRSEAVLETTTSWTGTEREDRLRSDLASLRLERDAAPRAKLRSARPRRRWLLPLLALLAALAGWVGLRARPLPVSVALARRAEPGAARAPL